MRVGLCVIAQTGWTVVDGVLLEADGILDGTA